MRFTAIYMITMNQHNGRKRHILVVDDEPLVSYTIQLLLQEDGYAIDRATSGSEALALYEPGKFDMVFTDYSMPEMKGDQLAAAIKQRSPKQAVVMITAFPEKLSHPRAPSVALIPLSANRSRWTPCGRPSPSTVPPPETR